MVGKGLGGSRVPFLYLFDEHDYSIPQHLGGVKTRTRKGRGFEVIQVEARSLKILCGAADPHALAMGYLNWQKNSKVGRVKGGSIGAS